MALHNGKRVAIKLQIGFDYCVSVFPVEFLESMVYIFLAPGDISLQNPTANQAIVPELSPQQHQIIKSFQGIVPFDAIEHLHKIRKGDQSGDAQESTVDINEAASPRNAPGRQPNKNNEPIYMGCLNVLLDCTVPVALSAATDSSARNQFILLRKWCDYEEQRSRA
jgi:hypothetical protein